MQGYDQMKYNLFWICDAGIRVLPQTLRDHIHKMTDRVALVHAVPYTAHRKGFSSAVEKVCSIAIASYFETAKSFGLSSIFTLAVLKNCGE